MDNDKLLRAYEKHLDRRGVRTRDAYVSTAFHFITWLEESNLDLYAVTTAIAEDYRRELLGGEQSRSKATVNNITARLKSFFGYVQDNGFRPDNPFCDLKSVPTGIRLPRQILDTREMGLLLDSWACERAIDVMLKSVAELLYGSSLRISEAESLRLQDILWNDGVLYVYDHKARKRLKRPMSEASAKALRLYISHCRSSLVSAHDEQEGFVYPQKCATQLRCLLNGKLKRECARLGLPLITSHSFRHSSATHLLRAGAGIRQVQMMLGHESIASTQWYTRVMKEDLKEVIDCCHPRERHHHEERKRA
ncbi:MAG: tyrosine-type recombinase/integrase [Candidatus Altiarchaeota archaeon]|nr:tyrosine-type recombinase/integrase [Candidatus Altiarchaeota archaeon]